MADTISKLCTKCNLELPTTEFRKDKTKPGGLYSSCKSCCKALERKRWAENPEFRKWHNDYRYRNPEAVKRNEIRQRTVNRDKLLKRKREYHHRVKDIPEVKEGWKKYRLEKREQIYAQQMRWREANREHVKERERQWRQNNPERSRAIASAGRAKRMAACAGGVSTTEVAEWLRTVAKKCYWCGKSCKKNFHVDHYVPLSRGGKHALANMVIACQPCNNRKHAKDPLDFAREVGRLL